MVLRESILRNDILPSISAKGHARRSLEIGNFVSPAPEGENLWNRRLF
jgi:hypothetical protein